MSHAHNIRRSHSTPTIDRIKKRHYNIALIDTSIAFPFALTRGMERRADAIGRDAGSNEERQYQLFSHLCRRTKYERRPRSYRNGAECYLEQAGICGEMSFAYIAMARHIGLKADYAKVMVDYKGKDVNHACAAVYGTGTILVDIAYRSFDISHQHYRILSDREVMRLYEVWR